MLTSKCRAKDRYSCPYHGDRAYKTAVEGLQIWRKELDSTNDYDRFDKLKQMVSRYELLVDSTEGGFKKLNKEFSKAIRSGDLEKQAELSERIRLATEKRLTDGQESEWYPDYHSRESYHFSNLVFKKALEATNGKVPIPIGLTGSVNIAELVHRCRQEGYEIKHISLSPTTTRAKKWDEVDLNEAQTKVMAYVKENGSNDWYDKVLEPNNVLARGITFVIEGKMVEVEGDWDLTDKIQWRE